MHNLNKIKIFRILLWATYPISLILIYPFIFIKKKKKSTLFFFFDRYTIGGAQKVHLDILDSVQDIPKTVYFTRKSPNDKLKETFFSIPNTFSYDIHFWCDHLLFRLFTVHYFAFYINRHQSPKVLSSNSTFFYDMLPFLRKKTSKIELLHNFSYGKKGMEFFGLANCQYLNKRLVIDGITFENILKQYREYNISKKYDSRVKLIEFGVDIPVRELKKAAPPLKVLYAGRGTFQKRIWLLNKIVESCLSRKIPVEFTFAGSMYSELSPFVKNNCTVYQEIGDAKVMSSLFKEAHAVILTSAFEGFPVVIKEAMSFGCIPIVTALPGNKIHLKHLDNALLMEEPENEQKVIEESISNIELLVLKPGIIQELSERAYSYAKDNFQKKEFYKKYRTLLLE